MPYLIVGWLTLTSLAGDLEDNLQNILNTHAKNSGVSVAILGEDWQWSSVAPTGTPKLQPDMAFRIASMTKTYTAATIFRLIENGSLGLQDPIGKHLSTEYVIMLRNAGYDPDLIRIEHLLTHTSGMREHPNSPAFMEKVGTQYQWTPSQLVRLAMDLGSPLAKPSQHFSYSDTGYVLLGQIIENTTNKILADAFRQLLNFKRLVVTNTWLETVEPQAERKRVHQFWGARNTYHWNPSFDLFGGGGLLATPMDTAIFLKALFNHQVLKDPENLKKMRDLKLNPALEQSGAGLYQIQAGGLRGWGHQGFWNTFMFYFPDLKMAIAGGFTNKEGGDAKKLLSNLIIALKP